MERNRFIRRNDSQKQPSKRHKNNAGKATQEENKDGEDESTKRRLIAQFRSPEGEICGPQLDLPADLTTEQLQTIINELLQNEDTMPYAFYVNETEILNSIAEVLTDENFSSEVVLPIVYHPQAVFQVRPVTRCTSSLPGHTEAILSVSFSPDGRKLASGSGDATVRLWDLDTETPQFTCSGHSNWVLCIAWSPDAKRIASGGMDGDVRIWDGESGSAVQTLRGHKKWITSMSWEPMHRNPLCNRLATASKDFSVRIWDVVLGACLLSLTSHTMAVSQVRWGGEGLIYSASHDRTIKVWEASSGKFVRELSGHAHWVNTLALSTDSILRTGPYDHTRRTFESPEAMQQAALERYRAATAGKPERLISGSDDFTLFLWEPSTSKKPLARLTGHQQLVNQVNFSPDGRYIASASFDKSVRIWDGLTGKFIATLRGHVGAVYQVCWSADSRLLVSGSKDSTMKVWDIKTKKIKFDLPGHADEVYTVDWSPDGQRVASGSKDRLLRIWRH